MCRRKSRGYSSVGRARGGIQSDCFVPGSSPGALTKIKTVKKMKQSAREPLIKPAGEAIMDMTDMLIKHGNSVDTILEQYEKKCPENELEKSVTYQVLKAGRKGMQRALDEMNDVLEKFGFKE